MSSMAGKAHHISMIPALCSKDFMDFPVIFDPYRVSLMIIPLKNKDP
jgi:hypothetical protein